MPLEITFLNQDFPDGKIFNISGLGSFPNGITVELTAEQEKAFLKRNGKTVKEAFKDSGNIYLSDNKNNLTRKGGEL